MRRQIEAESGAAVRRGRRAAGKKKCVNLTMACVARGVQTARIVTQGRRSGRRSGRRRGLRDFNPAQSKQASAARAGERTKNGVRVCVGKKLSTFAEDLMNRKTRQQRRQRQNDNFAKLFSVAFLSVRFLPFRERSMTLFRRE